MTLNSILIQSALLWVLFLHGICTGSPLDTEEREEKIMKRLGNACDEFKGKNYKLTNEAETVIFPYCAMEMDKKAFITYHKLRYADLMSNGYRRAVKAPEETKAGEDVITVTQPNSGISIIDQAKNVISARLGDIEILLTSPEDFLLKFKEDVSTSINKKSCGHSTTVTGWYLTAEAMRHYTVRNERDTHVIVSERIINYKRAAYKVFIAALIDEDEDNLLAFFCVDSSSNRNTKVAIVKEYLRADDFTKPMDESSLLIWRLSMSKQKLPEDVLVYRLRLRDLDRVIQDPPPINEHQSNISDTPECSCRIM